MDETQRKKQWLGLVFVLLVSLSVLSVFTFFLNPEPPVPSAPSFTLKTHENWQSLASTTADAQQKAQLWTLQVASFKDRRLATGFRDTMIRDGYEAAVVQTGVEWFSVRLAWSNSREDLLALKKEIEQKYRLQAQLVREK
jgi:cell division protein FtsN